MRCYNCGAKLQKGAVYCGKCGQDQREYTRQQVQAPRKKSRAPLVIVLVFLGLAIIAALLLVNLAGDKNKSGGDVNLVVSPSAPKGAEQSSQPPPQDEGDGNNWLTTPSLDYDEMRPLEGGAKESAGKYLNVYKDGRTGTVNFETGDVIFNLHSGEPLMLCDQAYAHNLPPDIEELAADDMKARAISERGFPYPVHGGHGYGDSLAWMYDAESGSMTPGYYSAMMFYQPPEGVSAENMPNTALVVNADAFDEMGWAADEAGIRYGLAGKSGNLLLSVEYEDITPPLEGEIWAVKKNGLWGYYSAAENKMITECVFSPMWEYEHYGRPGFFSGGYCPVRLDGNVGYIDTAGNMAVQPQFGGGSHAYKGTAWVKKDGLWGKIAIEQ